MEIYPDNTVAAYKVMLPQRIELEGKWECALADIQFPVSWFNVPPDEYFKVVARSGPNAVGAYIDVGEPAIAVPSGYYQSPSELLDAIKSVWTNYWEKVRNKLSALPEETPNRLKEVVPPGTYLNHADRLIKRRADDEQVPYMNEKSLTIALQKQCNKAIFRLSKSGYELKLTDVLADILDIDPKSFSMVEEGWWSNARKKTYISRSSVDLNRGNHSMYVYCSVVSDSVVGDKRVPLLRSFPISGKNTGTCSESFSRLQYIPVKSNNFDCIEVNLRNEQGNLVPFNYGHSCCVLHFRRVTPKLLD